jgi:hypothetical protein
MLDWTAYRRKQIATKWSRRTKSIYNDVTRKSAREPNREHTKRNWNIDGGGDGDGDSVWGVELTHCPKATKVPKHAGDTGVGVEAVSFNFSSLIEVRNTTHQDRIGERYLYNIDIATTDQVKSTIISSEGGHAHGWWMANHRATSSSFCASPFALSDPFISSCIFAVAAPSTAAFARLAFKTCAPVAPPAPHACPAVTPSGGVAVPPRKGKSSALGTFWARCTAWAGVEGVDSRCPRTLRGEWFGFEGSSVYDVPFRFRY